MNEEALGQITSVTKFSRPAGAIPSSQASIEPLDYPEDINEGEEENEEEENVELEEDFEAAESALKKVHKF